MLTKENRRVPGSAQETPLPEAIIVRVPEKIRKIDEEGSGNYEAEWHEWVKDLLEYLRLLKLKTVEVITRTAATGGTGASPLGTATAVGEDTGKFPLPIGAGGPGGSVPVNVSFPFTATQTPEFVAMWVYNLTDAQFRALRPQPISWDQNGFSCWLGGETDSANYVLFYQVFYTLTEESSETL